MTATYDPLAITAYHENGHCIGCLHYGWKFGGVRICEEKRHSQGLGSLTGWHLRPDWPRRVLHVRANQRGGYYRRPVA
jgi:hypothetical protein